MPQRIPFFSTLCRPARSRRAGAPPPAPRARARAAQPLHPPPPRPAPPASLSPPPPSPRAPPRWRAWRPPSRTRYARAGAHVWHRPRAARPRHAARAGRDAHTCKQKKAAATKEKQARIKKKKARVARVTRSRPRLARAAPPRGTRRFRAARNRLFVFGGKNVPRRGGGGGEGQAREPPSMAFWDGFCNMYIPIKSHAEVSVGGGPARAAGLVGGRRRTAPRPRAAAAAPARMGVCLAPAARAGREPPPGGPALAHGSPRGRGRTPRCRRATSAPRRAPAPRRPRAPRADKMRRSRPAAAPRPHAKRMRPTNPHSESFICGILKNPMESMCLPRVTVGACRGQLGGRAGFGDGFAWIPELSAGELRGIG